jgi:WD40 repeat protein
MPDGTAEVRWTQRCIDSWSQCRDFLYGLRVAWVSTASALIGLLLYFRAAQAQDLFLEVRGHLLSDTLFWLGFYVAVIMAWALPVFVSARWILARFEEGPKAHPRVRPVKVWVRRRVPLMLGAVCLAAVGVGQLMAMRNSPTFRDASVEELKAELRNQATKATKECQRTNPVQAAACIVIAIPNTVATGVGLTISALVGREMVPHVAYIIAAYVMFWFLFARPSGSASELKTPRYGRRAFLSTASFVSLGFVGGLLAFLLVLATRADAWLSLIGPALALLTVGVLAWLGMERTLWWLGTISAIPIGILIIFSFYGVVKVEAESAFGLAHLVLLPAATVVIGFLLWWALAPFSDGRASRFGQMLHWLGRGHGTIDEDRATLRFINPIFGTLLVVTLIVIALLVVVHPIVVTGPFRLHRAILLPVVLGMPVALFTYLTHWSARARAPLIFGLVLVVGAIGVLLHDHHRIRTVEGAPDRMKLDAVVDMWAGVNNCKEKLETCPAPIIVAAAGGASRSAFHVGGVIGNLLDEQRFSPLREHRSWVTAASFDVVGSRILTASLDGTAMIWDAGTGQLLRELFTPDAAAKAVRSARFGPNGKQVVTASEDKTATIWDAESARVVQKLEPHEEAVNSAEFSADGQLVVTASTDKLVRIWEVATGKLKYPPLQGHASAVTAATFHPDGSRIASGAFDGTVLVSDPATRKIHHTLRHDRAVRSIAFSPDGKRLLTASDDETARVWDAATGAPLHVLESHNGRVNSAAFSTDGTKIITAGWDNTVRIWDAATFEEQKILRAHTNKIMDAAFSTDGLRIITAAQDGTARVWNASTYKRQPWAVQAPRPFANQLFAISAVSGGSLGAVITYAALADAQRGNFTGTGLGFPPCTQNAMTDQDWFGAQVRGRQVQLADPVHSWRDCLQLLTSGDFLSPVVVGMVSNDPLRIDMRGNRAVVLEHAWEARYAHLTGQKDGLGITSKDDENTTLAQSLSTVRQKAAAQGIWLPILLLNGTSVQTGRRIITSDVDTLTRDATRKVTGRVFADSYDLHELLGHLETKGQAAKAAKLVCPGCDIRLSTAATMSARFPLISPPGTIVGGDGKTVMDRVVDGGYYENFGAITATELADELRRRGLPAPIVILISNEPHLSKMECVVDDVGYPSSTSTPWFPTFSSPLDALYGTSNARATHAAVNLCNSTGDRFVFIRVNPDRSDPRKELSMSWWLSKHVQKRLDEQIDDPVNLEALKRISPEARTN